MKTQAREKKSGQLNAASAALKLDPMQRLILIWGLVSMFLLTHRSWAQELGLGQASLGGTGCARESAEAVIEETAEGADIKIQFYAYAVEKEESGLKRANCALALPIQIPAGHQIEVSGASALSLVGLQGQDKLTVTSEIFLSGQQGLRAQATLEGPTLDFHSLEIPAAVVSQCGESVILRANTSLLLRNQSGLYGFGLIDHLATHVKLKKCDA